jgi:hypothetical protein
MEEVPVLLQIAGLNGGTYAEMTFTFGLANERAAGKTTG